LLTSFDAQVLKARPFFVKHPDAADNLKDSTMAFETAIIATMKDLGGENPSVYVYIMVGIVPADPLSTFPSNMMSPNTWHADTTGLQRVKINSQPT
jgi:hypothetical protein